MIKEAFINNKNKVTLVFLLSTITTLLQVFKSYLFGTYINILIEKKEQNTIIQFALILLSVLLIITFFSFLFGTQQSRLQAAIVFDINAKQLKHIKKLPISFFNQLDPVELNQRINSDSNVVTNFGLSIINTGLTQTISSVIILLLLFFSSKVIFLFSITSLLLYIFTYKIFEKKLYKVTKSFTERQNKLFASMNRHLKYPKFVKLNSLFSKLDNELASEYAKLIKNMKGYVRVRFAFSSITDTVNNLSDIFIYLYCGLMIFQNKMSIGEFLIIRNFYSILITSLTQMLMILNNYTNAVVSRDRLNDIENTKVESNGDGLIKDLNTIHVNNLGFHYDNGKSILANMEYQFEKGKIYTIRGSNGSGKSTLLNLILGLYIDQTKNCIAYNNKKIEAINMYDFREQNLAICEQEPALLYNSLSKNIDIKNTNISNFEKILAKLEFPYNKNCQCNSLSGGEKQKVSLAMAIAKECDLLVLDEPSSALDSESTKDLMEILNETKKSRITLIVTHEKIFDDIADVVINL